MRSDGCSILTSLRHSRADCTIAQKNESDRFHRRGCSWGTTAYMLQEVIEKQGGYSWLDSPPCTLPAKPHRPPYGSDGDYWSKPNTEQVFDVVYHILHEAESAHYPSLYPAE
jgi:hypothetical protein